MMGIYAMLDLYSRRWSILHHAITSYITFEISQRGAQTLIERGQGPL